MNQALFKKLSAETLGLVFGCFLAAAIIGTIYAALRNKSNTKEEFRARRNKAMFVVYWWWLFISVFTGLPRYSYIPGYIVMIMCSTFSVSVVVYLIYRFIIRIRQPDSKIDTEEKAAGSNSQASSTEKSEKGITQEDKAHNVIVRSQQGISHDDTEEYWSLISFIYSKVKQTSIFRLWRKEQFDCQFGKCAICGKPMDTRFAQVDHIQPRHKHGTNYSKNLALVCKKCNENKGDKTGYIKPEWIKDNKYSGKYDEEVYRITEQVRSEYPIKFPDDLFKR